MVIMGHKSYHSTLQYINFDKIIFGDNNEWICKTAETDEDRKNLIEAGFKLVEQANNKSYYHKQKTTRLLENTHSVEFVHFFPILSC